MLALICGLGSAIAWAVHDLLVRRLAQTGAVLPLIVVVVVAGCVALLLPAMIWGGWSRMTPSAYGFSVATGVAYIAGMMGLYSAFKLAPVRVVAPVLGSFPMISLAIAAAQGKTVATVEWLAVIAIVLGIALVAVLSRNAESDASVRLGPALGWAVLGAAGFATTFALGQEAARQGAELPAIVVARIVAAIGIVCLAILSRAPMTEVRGMLPTLALMGILDATALGLVQAAARLPNPEYAAITSALFGMLTILLAWRFLGEQVRPPQWLGIAMVFAGIAVLSAQG